MTKAEARAHARRYLRQYLKARSRKEDIERRKDAIHSDINDQTSTKTKALLEDIDRALDEQTTVTAQAIKNILEVIDYLPHHSQERDIIERRYIDGLSWASISRRLYISRSAAALWEQRGIDTLLDFVRVRQLIEQYNDTQTPANRSRDTDGQRAAL